ncbi:thiamine pyrophosphate-dependent enzyme [Gymnodinialimonas ceratoperidinii]|uniref:Thiamine pyrophosphate-binding protein n=1 Tax=Gymnodinialimonas ceratoperidinii TaxID=2856823 RepID=A0A8F6YBD8_9RHOB|nr:thiamine pyrophosphate-dependent enzyme [Gymnodinialimonas ceratoperidinii]QXT39981.1 thiamine pyrophosphate-binding protein [Gymnodinialimonas ceratoperidinii]
MTQVHGGKILADRLALHGVERVFSVPGESFLAALDGLHDLDIANVVCRQEGGAAMMAEAHGKMTGQPGVVFVTRGPGATNASAGLHIAMHDATPLVCFVGQIPLKHRDRGVFQEVDYRAFFGPLVKWSAEVERTDRLAEYVDRGFAIAQSGRPGPVVLALPEDILSALTDEPQLRPGARAPASVHPDDIAPMVEAFQQAKRPMILCGGSQWSDTERQAAQELAERTGAPIAVTFRRQDFIDNDHPNYAGDLGVGANPALGKRLADADCLLLLRAELNDITTADFTLIDPANAPTILQVSPDAEAVSKTYPATFAVTGTPAAVLPQLLAMTSSSDDRGAAEARAEYEAWQTPQATPGAVQMEQIICWLRDNASADTIITNGAGNYAAFLHRYYRFRQYGTQLAPTSGSMGYGLPAAVSAKLQHPDQPVICLAGDGCLQMTIQELSTARQHGADIIVIVANNGRYGTIRMHQEKNYPGRVSGTDLFNPDYAALAVAYGGTGHSITENGQFAAAYQKALKGGLHIIELKLDPKMLATTKNL